MYPDLTLIKTGSQFENLVAQYFISLKNNPKSGNYINDVQGPTVGPDGGTDILVNFRMEDGIHEKKWTWVIQCKLSKKVIGLPNIAGINIPSLIHSRNAVGYLLVCSNDVSSSLKIKFDDLNSNCRFHYNYKYWIGAEFQRKIFEVGDSALIDNYFNKNKKKTKR